MQMIVGLTGRAGSGKDTIADYLVREHGIIKLSFATTLKTMMAAAGFPEPANREDKEKPIPGFDFTWREAAQKLGTEWGRGLDNDIWIKITERRLQMFVEDARIVFSDVRFENEAAMIRRLGGKVLHVLGRAADLGENAEHASEKGVAFDRTCDTQIHNGGALNDTFNQVRNALWGAL